MEVLIATMPESWAAWITVATPNPASSTAMPVAPLSPNRPRTVSWTPANLSMAPKAPPAAVMRTITPHRTDITLPDDNGVGDLATTLAKLLVGNG